MKVEKECITDRYVYMMENFELDYVCLVKFAIDWNVKTSQARHIINTGRLIRYNRQNLN